MYNCKKLFLTVDQNNIKTKKTIANYFWKKLKQFYKIRHQLCKLYFRQNY